MALVIADRVRETSSTTGTGTLTLDGAVSGYQSFSTAIGNTNTCYYTITLGADWEVGLGTVSAGQLARTTVLKSSNAGAAVNFGAGTKDVFATYPGDKAVVTDNSHTFTAAQTFRAANGVRSEVAATQDAVVIAGRSGGTNSYAAILAPTTLTSSRNITLPNVSGTLPLLGSANTWTSTNTFSSTLTANARANFNNSGVSIDSSSGFNVTNTHLIIGASTGNFGNIQLVQGVLPTSVTIGSIEYQSTTISSQPDAGGVMYFTPAPSSRAAVVSEHFAIRIGTKTMTSNTSLQSIFAGGTSGLTNGTLTLPGQTTYFFECSLNLSSMSATSGNLGFSIVGAGTATFNSAAWHAIGLDATTQTTAAALGGIWSSANAQTGNIVTAATGTACSVLVKGIFSINAGGTIIPSIQLTTASAAVIGVNTWFKCYPVGVGDVSTIGNWG